MFNAAGIPTVKSGQTGLNTYRHCVAVAVVNLGFLHPKDRVVEQCIFGEDFAKREKMLLAGELGQGTMRSALRLPGPGPTAIIYSDNRVKEFFNLFVKGV
jgi:hypothetical protein